MSRDDVRLFEPGPFPCGDVATARLVRTEKSPQEVVGVYRLEPREPRVYAAKIGRLFDALDRKYAPSPGLWATVSLLPDASGEDFGLRVGMTVQHGQARSDAHRAFGGVSSVLVDATEIRALLAGYLARAGV